MNAIGITVVCLIALIPFSAVAYGISPFLSAIGGIIGAAYLIQVVPKKYQILCILLYPVVMIAIGCGILAVLTLPASLIWGEPFFGFDLHRIIR